MERAERKVQLPVIGPRLRPVLGLVLVLGVLLSANSIYLVTVTGVEVVTGNMYQDDYYLIMFLAHLGLGLLLILPLVTFAILHLRKAWFRPNRYAVSAGVSLFMAALVLLISGLLLTRFGFFEINDPSWRNGAYWVHVIAPLVVIWLFVLHRLAGRPLRWRIGAYVSAVAAVPVIGMLLFQFRERAPDLPVSDAYVPALVTLQDVARVRPQRLLQDETCAECHPQIVRQADWSMHRFSSFNNPAYRFSVEEARQVLLRRDGDLHAARLCAVCHDQVPLFSGRFDDPEYDPDQDAGGHAGITCMGCHGIIGVSSPRGNGDYILADPPSYPFASSDSKFLTAVNRQLIKAKPAFHKKTLLRPVHRSAQFCSACHKVHLPYALNHYRWLRGQNHYDSFWQSGMSGHRVDSFYYPERAVANCAHCHMPLTVSDDPSAKDVDGSGQRQVRNHLFAAANTALPALLNSPDESGNDSRVAMLRGAARVDIFGLKEDDINGRLYAPLRPVLPTLEPGRRYLLETVVRTLRIGHHLTQGTSDSNELWLDVRVFADGRLIGHSGQLDEAGEVDPWSYFLNSYVLDRDGNRIERRNAQDVFVALYDHQIPPGAASVVHFAFQVPREIRGAVSAEVSLKYRKFDSRFLRHVRRGTLLTMICRSQHLPAIG